MKLHRWTWKDVRRRHTGPNGRWLRPHADGIELFNIAKVPVTRYLYRGSKSPAPGPRQTTPDGRNRGEPAARRRARRVRRAAWGNGPRAIPAPRPRPTQPQAAALRRTRVPLVMRRSGSGRRIIRPCAARPRGPDRHARELRHRRRGHSDRSGTRAHCSGRPSSLMVLRIPQAGRACARRRDRARKGLTQRGRDVSGVERGGQPHQRRLSASYSPRGRRLRHAACSDLCAHCARIVRAEAENERAAALPKTLAQVKPLLRRGGSGI